MTDPAPLDTLSPLHGAAVVGDNQLQYVDHLAPIAHLLQIPLYFLNPRDCHRCREFYPDTQLLETSFTEFTPSFLLDNFEALFLSDFWNQTDFKARFHSLQKASGKSLRIVNCPHGFSDKMYYLVRVTAEDIALLYGQNFLDMLASVQLPAPRSYVIAGNQRLAYYLKFRQHFDAIAHKYILSHFPEQRPLVLYAPTWADAEQGSTFFDICDRLLEALPSHYNIVIKPHPRLESPLEDEAFIDYHRLVGRHHKKHNVLFLEEFPLIYPLLNVSDIYISDNSSVGYDFLYFERPMFFLNKHRRDPAKDRRALLFNCGANIHPEEYGRLWDIVAEQLPHDAALYTDRRRELYRYTFAPCKEPALLRQQITLACRDALPRHFDP